MAKREFLLRYILIIQKLQKGNFTLKEITKYLDYQSELQNLDLHISPRTFQRDLDEIRTIFNIDIQYDYAKKCYFIAAEAQGEPAARMLEAFEMFNAFNVTNELGKYLAFEKRKPAGTEHLFGLLHAIRNCRVIEMSYYKYEADEVVLRTVQPLLLKEFKSRWYLLATDQHDGFIKTFGLDRIQEMEITRKKFIPDSTFQADSYFRHCFGIIRPEDQEPQEIILSFDPWQGNYIKSFPLHESQKILVDDDNELRISLYLFITYDLIMELLQYGIRIKVIAPDALKHEIIETQKASLLQYQ